MGIDRVEGSGFAATDLRGRWGWFVALGVLFLVLAAIAFGNLVLATLASVLFVGAMMIVGAVAQIVHAFQVQRWSGFFYWLLAGLLYGLAGVFAFMNPMLAAATLTVVFAAALVAAGLLRIWLGLRLKPQSGWGWILTSGIITLLTGLVFLLGWPTNTLWLLGIVLAVDLAIQGIALIAFGLALKAPSTKRL